MHSNQNLKSEIGKHPPFTARYCRGFTLLEVLLSILILFTMGLALLKFDGWIKEDLYRYRQKAVLLYQTTPLLYASIQRIRRKNVSVFDTARFTKLRDDELFWLRSLKGRVTVGKEEKKTLFQSGELDLTYRYYPLRLEQGETSVSFIRIKP
ncbi:type IV pilus modification PilV family protein [Hydrogenimonas urashimensis]|uniref:type IV pilus modification PilV family protein n=1 Tax=Hydrogenimonas urashimensis TaxID=2740515 RepID=UPI0019154404|nr:prepilin-type N-terminal cleavage/methylation domain-containing protein [Hydrogenimonas urashimensis]